MLILAMVIAAAITHAYNKAKGRTQATYDEYRRRAQEKAAARDKARQESAAAWEQRLNEAHVAGPRAPLWWAHAVGWLIAGVAAAAIAGVTGAAAGAIEGARSGYAVGREGGRQGWKFAQSFRQWRKQNQRTPIELAQCERCKGWITGDQLTNTDEFGRVCPDCVPSGPASPWENDEPEPQEEVVHERRPDDVPPRKCANGCGLLAAYGYELCALCRIEALNRWEREEERRRAEEQGQCDGRCTNSNLGPSEARARGLCPDCAGQGELITNFGGVHKHVPCRMCKGSGKFKHSGGPRERFQVSRCACGRPITEGTRCDACARTKQAKQQAEQDKTSPIRVTAERIYPEPKHKPKPKEIENTMTAIEPAQANNIDSSGEGYDTTVSALGGLTSLMGEVHSRLNDLNEQLTSNSLDADTLSKISDLTDEIESVEEKAKDVYQHVESRHQSLAAATAEAGGSQNVATKSWYDGH